MQQILLFLGENNTYTTLLGPARLFFLQTLIFTYINEKKSYLRVYKFSRNLPPTQLNDPTQLFDRLEYMN